MWGMWNRDSTLPPKIKRNSVLHVCPLDKVGTDFFKGNNYKNFAFVFVKQSKKLHQKDTAL
jgi:hypothetical protein